MFVKSSSDFLSFTFMRFASYDCCRHSFCKYNNIIVFLKAPLLSNKGVTHRLPHSLTDNVTFSCFGHVPVVCESI